jgi:ferredoxin
VRVTVDLETCEAYGQCVMYAPQVFDLGDDDDVVRLLDPEPDDALRGAVSESADACPVNAISIED